MPRQVQCPKCRRDTSWDDNPYRPFCSKRCHLIDLGAWIDERYRIPGQEADLGADGDDEEDEQNPYN